MSLFNVDKNSQDRGSPRVNSHDVLLQRPNHGTISTQYQSIPQSQTNGFVKMQNQSILANDGTNNIASFGYNPALKQWGVYTTQDGTDVTTNTDLSKFTFNSNQNVYKIVKTVPVSVTITYNASKGTNAFSQTAHGLSFTPAYDAFITIPSYLAGLVGGIAVNGPNPYMSFAVAGSGVSIIPTVFAIVSVDATNINFYVAVAVEGSGTDTFTASVDLLQRTL